MTPHHDLVLGILILALATALGRSAAREHRYQRRAKTAEALLGQVTRLPEDRAGLCAHSVETLALMRLPCDLVEGHDGFCERGRVARSPW